MSVLPILILCVSATAAFPTATTEQDAEARINSWVINPIRRPGMSIGGLRPGGMLLMVMEPNATMAPEPIPPQEEELPQQVGITGSSLGTIDTSAEGTESAISIDLGGGTDTQDTPIVGEQTSESTVAEDTATTTQAHNDTVTSGVSDTTTVPAESGVSLSITETPLVAEGTSESTGDKETEVALPVEVSTSQETVGDLNEGATSQPDADTQEQGIDETVTENNQLPHATTQDPSGSTTAEVAVSNEDDTTQSPSGSVTEGSDNSESNPVSTNEAQLGSDPTAVDPADDNSGSGITEAIAEDSAPTEVPESSDAPQVAETNPAEDALAQDPSGSTSAAGTEDVPEQSTETVPPQSSDPYNESTESNPNAADSQDQVGSTSSVTEPIANTEEEQNTETILADVQETAELSTEQSDPVQQESSQTIFEDSANLGLTEALGSDEPQASTETLLNNDAGNQDPSGSDNNQEEDAEQSTELVAAVNDPDTQLATETIPQEETPNQDPLGVNIPEAQDPEQSTELSEAVNDPAIQQGIETIPQVTPSQDLSGLNAAEYPAEQSTESYLTLNDPTIPVLSDPETEQSTEAVINEEVQDPSEYITADAQSPESIHVAQDPINSVLSEDDHSTQEESTEQNPAEDITHQQYQIQDHVEDPTEDTTEAQSSEGTAENDPQAVQPQEFTINPDQHQVTEAILQSINSEPESEQTTSYPDYFAVDPTYDPLQAHLFENQESSTDPSPNKPPIFSGPALDDFQLQNQVVTFNEVTVPPTESDPGTTEPVAPLQTADSNPILSEDVSDAESSQRRKRSPELADKSPSRQFGHRPYPLPYNPGLQPIRNPSYGVSTARRMYDYCYGLLCEIKRNLLSFKLF